jgi:hypothetical protein
LRRAFLQIDLYALLTALCLSLGAMGAAAG